MKSAEIIKAFWELTKRGAYSVASIRRSDVGRHIEWRVEIVYMRNDITYWMISKSGPRQSVAMAAAMKAYGQAVK
jgi:hypothetical protein